MIALKDIRPVDNGAKFLNVDLHIHTYGGSADVKDPALTPEAIVDSAVKQNLSVIAITDHNSNISVEAAMAHAQQYADKLMVLPGVEVTTAHGHLLVYFAPENYKELGKFLVKIELIGEMGAENSRTAKSMADVIAEAEKHGAICVAAHIDREKTGFEKFAPGFQDWKRDIICSSGLYGLEHDDISTIDWYSNQDDSSPAGSERKKIYSARAATVKLEGRHHLAHLQGSDSHSLAQFESSDPNKVWTKIKLTELSWSAFRTALIDPTARVRPTQSVPRLTPRILGMGIAGGFLNGEKLHFSDNLNCLIGGRGTGKSTAIRALAYGLGMIDDFAE
ncbi:MAG: PHP domain-containing protein, partial [Armatimonadetes bacterium]|nr:PHP domain-containing protein [Armatimonadota bacterium]